ncbi:MAG: hypothetical protein ACE15B_23285 [Bryobacteraceae bacterium]
MRIVIALAAVALTAAPAGFQVFRAADLKAPAKTGKVANWGNHSMDLAHREKNGEAELHETQNDIFVVQSGAATLIVGGAVESPRKTAPGEIRGAGIKGGEKHAIAAGDIVHIPANTPHQMLVAKQVTYAIIKVDVR